MSPLRQNAPRGPVTRAGPPTPTTRSAGPPRQIAPHRDDSRLQSEIPPPAVFSRPPSVPHLPWQPTSSASQKENHQALAPGTNRSPNFRASAAQRRRQLPHLDGTSERRQFHPHRRRLPRGEHPPCQRQFTEFPAPSHHHHLAKPNSRPAPATPPSPRLLALTPALISRLSAPRTAKSPTSSDPGSTPSSPGSSAPRSPRAAPRFGSTLSLAAPRPDPPRSRP